jgi:hypothetical protein
LRFGQTAATRYDAAMRFSLKWLLVGMAYCAVAAAAFAKPHWGSILTLQAVTFFSVVYAIVV